MTTSKKRAPAKKRAPKKKAAPKKTASKKNAKADPKESKMGRPTIEIDWVLFDYLCHLQCTLEEIAGAFGCSEDTIQKRVKEEYNVTFTVYYAEKSAFGKASLRRTQFKKAVQDEDVKMLIHLGKQYLNQSDKTEAKLNFPERDFNINFRDYKRPDSADGS